MNMEPADKSGEHGDSAEANALASTRDVVMTRLLDGRAQAAEWRELRALTKRDEEAWDDLIAQSEQGDALARMVGQAVGRAAGVPAERAVVGSIQAARGDVGERAGESGNERSGHRSGDRLGWLVAAVLAVGFVAVVVKPGGQPIMSGGGGNTVKEAGLGSGLASGLFSGSADDALKHYVQVGKQQGRVVGELPQRVVLETRELPNGGGREVLYVRQIVERAVVQEMYRLGSDELGLPVMVPSGGAITPDRSLQVD